MSATPSTNPGGEAPPTGPATREAAAAFDPVSAFRKATERGGGHSPALGWYEGLMVVALSLALCVPPWLLGGMRAWAQGWILGLACVPFLLLWLPFGGDRARPKNHLHKLLCFPVFWCGLVFLGYVAIQAWNVNWEYTLGNDGRQWWMTKLAESTYVSWLPTGMAAPFEQMNGWRVWIIFAAPLLWVCAFAVGLKRRRSVLLVLWAFALNGFAVGLLLILQRLTGAEEIYWTFPSVNSLYGGPFTYRNHAGAYLNLALGVQLGLFFYYSARARRTIGRSSPHLLLLFLALMQVTALLFCASRGALLAAVPILASGFLLFLGQSMLGGRKGVGVAAVVLVFAAAAVYFLWPVIEESFPELERRWQQSMKTLELEELDSDRRMLATQATYQMFSDNPWTGWGAGSFRWYFPVYQQQYEQIHRVVDRRGRVRRSFFWHQAHNDWLQYPAEYGIIGCLPLAVFLLYWLVTPWRHIRQWGAWVVPPLAGVLAVLLHAVVDFPLQNPPVLFAFVCALAMPAKLLAVQPRRS